MGAQYDAYCTADLLFYEERAIAAFDAVVTGYNCRRLPSSNLGIKMPPKSEALRRLISEQKKGKKRPHVTPMKGKRHTPEARAKMRAARPDAAISGE